MRMFVGVPSVELQNELPLGIDELLVLGAFVTAPAATQPLVPAALAHHPHDSARQIIAVFLDQLLLLRVENPARFAELQIYGDLLLETLLIYLTGGPYSAFPFIYLLSILAAGIAVAPRRSFVVATTAVLMHGLCLAGQVE